MPEAAWVQQIALPLGLGLFGFVEPCSIGSTLLFIKTLEGRPGAAKIAQTGVFTVTRTLLMGLLGGAAAAIGGALFAFQKAVWIVFGTAYVLLGVVYLAGKGSLLLRAFGDRLSIFSGMHGSATLGAVFALNIPACATPLLLALLGLSAARGATGSTAAHGFLILALFGLALSLPLVAAVLSGTARGALDRLAALSRRAPLWTGVVLIALGLWSIWFGLFARSVTPS